MCDGRFSILKINTTFDYRISCAADWGRNRSALAGNSFNNGQIGTAYLTISHLNRKNRGTECIFCQDQCTGGITVKPVDTTKRTRFSFCFQISGNSVGKCVGIIAKGRMNRHIGGVFVYYQNIFVFIEYGNVQRRWEDAVGGNGFEKSDSKMITAGKNCPSAGFLSI